MIARASGAWKDETESIEWAFLGVLGRMGVYLSLRLCGPGGRKGNITEQIHIRARHSVSFLIYFDHDLEKDVGELGS